MSSDNVELKFDAAICLRIVDAKKAVMMLSSGTPVSQIDIDCLRRADTLRARDSLFESFIINNHGFSFVSFSTDQTLISIRYSSLSN